MSDFNSGYLWKAAAIALAFVSTGLFFYVLGSKNQGAPTAQVHSSGTNNPTSVQNAKQPDASTLCPAAAQQLRAISFQWSEAVKLATATPRIGLSERIADLQRIRREIEGLSVPECASKAKKLFIAGTAIRINQFMLFLGDGSKYALAEIEEAVDVLLGKSISREQLLDEVSWNFDLELRGLEGCDSTCKQQLISKRAQEQEALKVAQRRTEIDRVLNGIKADLHNPASAQFENVVWNPDNGAVCGQLIAKNGRGVLVRETFAVSPRDRVKTIGFDLNTRVNVGEIAARRLCGDIRSPVETSRATNSQVPLQPLGPGQMRGTIK